jgi:hypothetical protein
MENFAERLQCEANGETNTAYGLYPGPAGEKPSGLRVGLTVRLMRGI